MVSFNEIYKQNITFCEKVIFILYASSTIKATRFWYPQDTSVRNIFVFSEYEKRTRWVACGKSLWFESHFYVKKNGPEKF